MQEVHSSLVKLNVKVVVLSFENLATIRHYVSETKCKWPVVSDQNRELYHGYGMGPARLRHLWGLSTWTAYLREFRKGMIPRIPVADTFQQGGDVLIDANGIVQSIYVGEGPGDRPAVGDVIAVRRTMK